MDSINEPQKPIQVVVAKTEKNLGIAVVLAAIFGPLGLFYASIAVSFLVGLLTFGVGLLFTWPLCILWTYLATKRYNAKLTSASAVL